MKNKRLLWIIGGMLILFSILIMYVFKPLTMDDINNKPNFTGVVIEVHEKSILVLVNDDEDEFKSSDKMSVSLDVQLKDSMIDFEVGNTVKVFYDGSIAESYPAQINTVFAIVLLDE